VHESANGYFVIPAQAGIQRQESNMKQPAVYLMASQRNGTLYIGVTSDLIQRVWQHKNHVVEGFTEKYNVELLVWYEQHETMESAIVREKAIKKWNRAWKLKMIEKTNPDWSDLWPVITGEQVDFRVADTDCYSHVPSRHSRAGGNPAEQTSPHSGQPHCPVEPEFSNPLDSRLRGNDGVEGEA
jgi:putative endonuclease